MNSSRSIVYCGVLLLLASTGGVRAQREDPKHPTWDFYHSSAAAHALLEAWVREYPTLTNLYSIGETLEGTPLLVLEITNAATGDASDKPAYYYDGNIHAGELTAAEVALHFAWYVLDTQRSRWGWVCNSDAGAESQWKVEEELRRFPHNRASCRRRNGGRFLRRVLRGYR